MPDDTPLPHTQAADHGPTAAAPPDSASPGRAEKARSARVHWTVRARRHLRNILAEAACRQAHGSGADVLEDKMSQLDAILAHTFPRARSVVVQEEFVGFRPREDRHIVLVEVFGSKRAGTYVVKIGPAALLEKELQGWKRCRPPGLRNDLVFLPLQEGWRGSAPGADGQTLMSLVYGDAQQLLGVQTTCTLEEAILRTVVSGVPTVQSAGDVLNELFERIGYLLYTQSFVEDPARDGSRLSLRHLDDNLLLWETEPAAVAVRRDANTLAASGASRFLDPADYLRHVQAIAAATDAAGDATHPRPRPVDVMPRLLRGSAHGDLHGRNVLVGIVHGRVLWPTVFDYEDMSPCNYLGWDFVKLETELKVRIYPELFPGGSPAGYIRKVQQAEIALNEQTERCHQARAWPATAETADPAERLRVLLGEIRRLAALHLGADRGRPNEWLEEYYFLLTGYGITTARFRNLQPRERLTAFLSAGIAAARLSWPRSVLAGTVTDNDVERILQTRYPSYHLPLAAAQKWVRTRKDDDMRRAVELLCELRDRYPHALVIGQELVLALMEGGRREEAERILQELERQFPTLDEETLCRWGRLHKEQGDRYAVSSGDRNTAAACYGMALARYEAAYQIRSGHYPGINKAAVLFLLGSLDPSAAKDGAAAACRRQAEDTARSLLARRGDWPRDLADDLTVWHPATEAEARLLLQEWEPAADLYRQVQKVPGLPAHAIESMRRQVERILHGYHNLGITATGPFQDLDTLFPSRAP